MQFTLNELTQGLNVTIKGDPNYLIDGIAVITQAKPNHLTFLINPLYRKFLASTQAGAIILEEKNAIDCSNNLIICQNPHYVYAKMATYFLAAKSTDHSIDKTVATGVDSHISQHASIGPHCTIGDRVKIAANVVIGAGCHIGDDVEIDQDTAIDAHVTIYHRVKIGKRVHIKSGAIIGGDGFGFANEKGVWHKVPQLGGVCIGDDVDIGANTTIDRGALDDTIIEDGVKLDNLIQVGHNVRIGSNTIIAGCVAIAGSVTIGKNCMIGGASCLAGHIHLCDNAIITGMTAVTKSITVPGMYSSGIVGAVPNQEFRKNNARFHRLENLMHRVKTLELELKEMKERKNK